MNTIPISPVAAIVEYCQTLFDDLDFGAVKAWKAAVPGRKAIGYMPVYVPRELIHAAGMLPVGILGGGDSLEVIQGDAYYQSYICRIPRSTIELGLTGRLDCLDGMLFPSICDVIRNLSGMWQILFKDKYVKYVDVPQNYQDSVGGNFYIQEMETVREDLGRLRGTPITDAELNASIAVYNDNRAAVRELYAYRAAKPWQAPTAEVYLLLRAGMVLPPEEHTVLVREYIAATDAVLAPEARQRPGRDQRIVLRAAAARADQVDRDVGLLHRRRRLHARHALAARRGAGRREPARRALEGVPAPQRLDRREVRDDARGEGRLPDAAGQDRRAPRA